MRTHYGPWQPCWISNQHQKHKSGRGPSNEHFWQVWLKSVLRFQRRRFKCEKLTNGRTLTHDKSSHGLWPGELKISISAHIFNIKLYKNNQDIIISTYILTSIIMKIKQDIISIYIFFIILHENKLKILQAQIFLLSYFIKITKNNQYITQSH